MHDLSEEFAHPKINVLHLPEHFSQLEARNTDDDNAKQQKRKIEDSSNCSQPLACAQVSHPLFKQAEERPALRSAQRNHRCPLSNKRHFSLHNRAVGRGTYISNGRNLWTCLNRPNNHQQGRTGQTRRSCRWYTIYSYKTVMFDRVFARRVLELCNGSSLIKSSSQGSSKSRCSTKKTCLSKILLNM